MNTEQVKAMREALERGLDESMEEYQKSLDETLERLEKDGAERTE